MDPGSRWKIILSRKRKQLPLDIEHCSPISLRNIILDARTPAAILDRIAQVYCDDEYLLRDLVRCPNLAEETLAFIALTASDEIKGFISGTRVMDLVVVDPRAVAGGAASAQQGKDGEEPGKKKLNVQQIINRMTTPQKIKLALKGGKDARGLLIRESNKQISMSVLENPRITDGEVEFFAQSQNLSEDVIRRIGTNSDWSKKYTIVHSLVFNPKTPIGVSVGFVTRMNDRDLALLEKSRNVPEAVRTTARNTLVRRKLGKK